MNYFSILNLAEQFNLPPNLLEENFQELATQFHPDRFAAESAFEKKQAMALFTTINQAYNILNNPFSRAEYILELNQINYDKENTSKQDFDFFETQIELREAIDEADSIGELSQIKSKIESLSVNIIQNLSNSIAEENWEQTISQIEQGKFFEKLNQAIENKITSMKISTESL